jgi:hypothetical protein
VTQPFAVWRVEASELAALLYQHDLVGLDQELLAGYEAGDTAAECLASIFADE